MRPIALLLFAHLLAAGTTTAQSPSDARDTVDAFVGAFMEEHRVPGIAVAILEDGRLVKARGYGLADVEHSAPVTAETISPWTTRSPAISRRRRRHGTR